MSSFIDLFLVLGGVALALLVHPALGVPVLVLGAVVPVLRITSRRASGTALLHLVPAELADAYRALAAVAPPDVVTQSDGAVREVATLLAGRPARGRAHERLVAEHVTAMRDTTVAWTAARAEIDAIAPDVPTRPSGPLVVVTMIVLFPFFIAWDIVIGVRDGMAIRARALVRVVVRLVSRWRDAIDAVQAAAAEARRRFTLVRRPRVPSRSR